PARRSHDEQRGHDEGEQQMLEHVRAEQERIAQVVQWTVERQEHHDHANGKERRLRAPERRDRRVRGGRSTGTKALSRAPDVQRDEQGQSNHRAPVHGKTTQRNGRARVKQRERECMRHDYLVSVSFEKRNMSAMIVLIATISGPVNSARNRRWSYLRCM